MPDPGHSLSHPDAVLHQANSDTFNGHGSYPTPSILTPTISPTLRPYHGSDVHHVSEAAI